MTLIAFLIFSNEIQAGFLKKIIRETKRVVHQAASLPQKIPRETARIVDQVIQVTQPQSKTEVHATRNPLKFHGDPVVTITRESFVANTYDDLVNKLKGIGIESPESFSRLAMQAKSKSQISWRFVIPAMDAPNDKAKMSYLDVVASNDRDRGVVTVNWSQMIAEVGISAHEVFHWRTVRKQWGNNQETKNDVTQPRGLTREEINEISTKLSAAITSDPRFATLPAGTTVQEEL